MGASSSRQPVAPPCWVRVQFSEAVVRAHGHRDAPAAVEHSFVSTWMRVHDDELLFGVDDEVFERWAVGVVETVHWTLERPARPAAYTVEEKRQAHPRAYERWTAEEDAQLRVESGQGLEIDDICRRHARNDGAIRSRLHKLGLTTEEPRPSGATARRVEAVT
jgi:hypothetical protein